MKSFSICLIVLTLVCLPPVCAGQDSSASVERGTESLRQELLSLKQVEQDARKLMLQRLGKLGISMTSGQPIEETIDSRRAELGLQPLAEYIQSAQTEYGKLTKGKNDDGK